MTSQSTSAILPPNPSGRNPKDNTHSSGRSRSRRSGIGGSPGQFRSARTMVSSPSTLGRWTGHPVTFSIANVPMITMSRRDFGTCTLIRIASARQRVARTLNFAPSIAIARPGRSRNAGLGLSQAASPKQNANRMTRLHQAGMLTGMPGSCRDDINTPLPTPNIRPGRCSHFA